MWTKRDAELHGREFAIGSTTRLTTKLHEPLICDTCGKSIFLVLVNSKSFRDALKEALSNLAASEQYSGGLFFEKISGNNYFDPSLKMASSFDILWEQIRSIVNQQPDSTINTNYKFNMVYAGRNLEQPIHAICHFNKTTRITVIIHKDVDSNYWFSVEDPLRKLPKKEVIQVKKDFGGGFYVLYSTMLYELQRFLTQANEWGKKNGWPSVVNYPQYEDIRGWGRVANGWGGIELMRAAYDELSEQNPLVKISEYWWDGIGGWQA